MLLVERSAGASSIPRRFVAGRRGFFGLEMASGPMPDKSGEIEELQHLIRASKDLVKRNRQRIETLDRLIDRRRIRESAWPPERVEGPPPPSQP